MQAVLKDAGSQFAMANPCTLLAPWINASPPASAHGQDTGGNDTEYNTGANYRAASARQSKTEVWRTG